MPYWNWAAALLFYLAAVMTIAEQRDWGMASIWFALGAAFTGEGFQRVRRTGSGDRRPGLRDD